MRCEPCDNSSCIAGLGRNLDRSARQLRPAVPSAPTSRDRPAASAWRRAHRSAAARWRRQVGRRHERTREAKRQEHEPQLLLSSGDDTRSPLSGTFVRHNTQTKGPSFSRVAFRSDQPSTAVGTTRNLYGIQHQCRPLSSNVHHRPVFEFTMMEPSTGPGP
jgi:hypothetical protein